MGKSSSIKEICKWGKKRNFKRQDGQCEILTIIETVFAGGVILPPYMIYQGTAQLKGRQALVAARDKEYFSYSETGWMNQKIGLAYLENNFQPNTVQM